MFTAAPAAARTNYALIIGVNRYPALHGADLTGPANDAALVLGYLTSTPDVGFQRRNITVLANGGTVLSDGEPTLANILAALDALAAKAGPGDFVYLHFGGHGSRQAARDPSSEIDGKDEVFLPSDTALPRDGAYPNALVDDDVGARIDAIRARGATVFAVFDSCHSSTATRAVVDAGNGIRERFLPDVDAGAEAARPIVAREMRQPALSPADVPPDARGALVAFFAAQTVEPTPELRLPPKAPDAAVHGLFTWTLVQQLATRPGLTYRELGQAVLYAYAQANLSGPTPMFEGDLDRVAFAAERKPPVLQLRATVAGDAVELAAGTIQGLREGTILRLLPEPLSQDDVTLGFLRVVGASPFSARAVPVEYDGHPAPRLSGLPAASFARPVEIALASELTVGMPEAGAEAARHAIEAIAADSTLPLHLKLAEGSEPADLRLVVGSRDAFLGKGGTEPRLWFVPADGRMSADPQVETHSIGLAGGLSGDSLVQLRDNLVAAFRAVSLSRLAPVSSFPNDRVTARLSIRREGAAETEPFAPSSVPVLSPGDEIHLTVRNGSARPVDVDVLMIGSDYSIEHVMGERFQAGDGFYHPLIGIGPDGFGRRRILVVLREADNATEYADLGFLAQTGMRTRGPATVGTSDFTQMLHKIAEDPPTRGGARYQPPAQGRHGALTIYSAESVPR